MAIGIFEATKDSGDPIYGSPGASGQGTIIHGSFINSMKHFSLSVLGDGYSVLQTSDGEAVYSKNLKVYRGVKQEVVDHNENSLLAYAVDSSGATSGTLAPLILESVGMYIFRQKRRRSCNKRT